MKTKLLFILVMGLMVLGMSSCKKATYLTADKTTLSFDRTGGNETIVLDCDVPDYDFESVPEWIKASLDGSNLGITVSQNDSGAPRDGELVISSAGQTLTINISQAYVATKLNVAETSVTIPKEGGTKEVSVETDGDVQITAPEFVSASLENGQLVITASTNDEAVKKGDITLTAGQFSATIQVTQEGNVCPTCHGKGKITCPKCHGRGWYDTGGEGGCCTRCGGVDNGDPMTSHNGSGKIKCPTCGGTGH